MKKLTAILLLALVSAAVFAQPQAMDVPRSDESDYSMKMWAALFGDFAKDPFDQLGGPTTVLGMMLLIFNGCVSAITVAWLGYGVISGIIGTAQDGEALGQRINTAWYPIRVVVGVSSALPIFAGFTAAQAVLMFVAVKGIDVANYLYRGAVETQQLSQLVGTGHLNAAPHVSHAELVKAARTMLEGHVCMKANARLAQEIEGAGGDLRTRPDLIMMARADATPDGMVIRYGSRPNPTACGAVAVRMERTRSGDTGVLGMGGAFRVASVDYDGIRKSVSTGLAQRLLAADKLMATAATMYMGASDAWHTVKNGEQFQWPDAALVNQSIAAVRSDMKTLVDNSVRGGASSINETARANMLAYGWAGAGAWSSTWFEANAALADAVSGVKLTTQEPSDLSMPVAEELDRLGAVLARAEKLANQTLDVVADPVQIALQETCGDTPSMIGTATSNCSLGQQLAMRLIGATSSDSGGAGLVNPLVTLKNTGDWLMTLGGTLVSLQFTPVIEAAASASKWVGRTVGAVATAVGLPGVGAAAGVASQAASAVETVVAHATPMGWSLLLVGAALSLYLPMIPFLIWVSALVSYAASFIEGLVAMPLHSMSHMHTDGEGLGQQTSKGYLFFLNIFARPSLMVIAFVFANALVIALGTFVTTLYAPVVASVQGNSMTGIFSIVGLVFIYFVLMVLIVRQSFALIEDVPDRVISYLGSGDMNSLGRGVEQKMAMLFSRITTGGTVAGQSAAAGGAALKKQREREGRK